MSPEAFKDLEDRLWQTADSLRANSDLKSSEYSVPVLGLIFLKFADNKYSQYEEEIKEQDYSLNPGRYVGVVIEKDGKTEAEFLTELAEMHEEFEKLNKEAQVLEGIISNNICRLTET